MKYLRKRLVCANRGNDNDNSKAMDKVMNRYIEKMKEKGWVFNPEIANITEGNQFFKFERYITLCKQK